MTPGARPSPDAGAERARRPRWPSHAAAAVAVVLGSYVAAAGAVAAAATALAAAGMAAAESVLVAAMLGFPGWVGLLIWGFAARRRHVLPVLPLVAAGGFALASILGRG